MQSRCPDHVCGAAPEGCFTRGCCERKQLCNRVLCAWVEGRRRVGDVSSHEGPLEAMCRGGLVLERLSARHCQIVARLSRPEAYQLKQRQLMFCVHTESSKSKSVFASTTHHTAVHDTWQEDTCLPSQCSRA